MRVAQCGGFQGSKGKAMGAPVRDLLQATCLSLPHTPTRLDYPSLPHLGYARFRGAHKSTIGTKERKHPPILDAVKATIESSEPAGEDCWDMPPHIFPRTGLAKILQTDESSLQAGVEYYIYIRYLLAGNDP